MREYGKRLDSIRGRGLLRSLSLFEDPELLDFSSNDYLDLANHPLLAEASAKAARDLGCSVSASRLMSGNIRLHQELEVELAELVGLDSALLFGSGFLANIGLISSITGRDDIIFADRLNHASLVDGARLSRGQVIRYRHCDLDHLEHLLNTRNCPGRRYIVSDSLFSMDGDIAPLRELQHLAAVHDSLLVVDEAHAIGVFGSGGGICREIGVRPHVVVGTLSKALGSYGGFAAGSAEMKKYLVNIARSFIYTTGLPPSCCAAAMAALSLVRLDPQAGGRLLDSASRFRDLLRSAGLSTAGSSSQIIPVILGENQTATRVSKKLFDHGIGAVAVRPPTVPKGTSRLRLSVTLKHREADFQRVIDVLNANEVIRT